MSIQLFASAGGGIGQSQAQPTIVKLNIVVNRLILIKLAQISFLSVVDWDYLDCMGWAWLCLVMLPELSGLSLVDVGQVGLGLLSWVVNWVGLVDLGWLIGVKAG